MKSSKKIALTIFCLSGVAFTSFGQGGMTDNQNRPLLTKSYVDVNGSPYFNDNFVKGSVKLSDGKKYDNVYLQLDEVKSTLLFKDTKDTKEAMEYSLPVSEFNLNLENGTVANFKKVASDEKNTGFYQVIYDGKFSLLKRTRKSVVTKATYGTANVEKNINAVTVFMVVSPDQKFTPVKADKKAFLQYFGSKSGDMETFISKEQIDFKKDADLVKLFAYFNSLS